MIRRLTEEQSQFKEITLELARIAYRSNADLLNEYNAVDEWRLTRADDDIVVVHGTAIKKGDLTIAKKEALGRAVPRIWIFAWRHQQTLILKDTDPVQFLED